MSGTPVLPKQRGIDMNAETMGHHLSPTATKMSAQKGFVWIMFWTAFWMGGLYGFYKVTEMIFGR